MLQNKPNTPRSPFDGITNTFEKYVIENSHKIQGYNNYIAKQAVSPRGGSIAIPSTMPPRSSSGERLSEYISSNVTGRN